MRTIDLKKNLTKSKISVAQRVFKNVKIFMLRAFSSCLTCGVFALPLI